MKNPLAFNSVLKLANYREKGIRRWDITEHIFLFYSTIEEHYDGHMLWKNNWCVHLHWEDKFKPWVPIKISRDEAFKLLKTKF